MFSPNAEHTMEPVVHTGFTAINQPDPPLPGRYDVLPPESPFRETSVHHACSTTNGMLDENDVLGDSPLDDIGSFDEQEMGKFIKESIEHDEDTITIRPTPDIDGDTSSIDDKVDSEYSYSAIKSEACKEYGENKPDFCVMNSKNEKIRPVLDALSEEIVKMKFCHWQLESYGY